MRRAIALFWLLCLSASLLNAQAYTTVSATNVLVDNGSGTAIHPASGSQLCFLGVNNAGVPITYTPSGGSPTTGTVCGTLNGSGALTGSLQVGNPATASPLGLLYTITVINGSTTYLTIPTVGVSGALFNFNAFSLSGSGAALGIGKAHLACSDGAQWTSTTLPAGQSNQRCNISGLWDSYPPAIYCPAGTAQLIPQQGGTPMCQAPTFEGLGAPSGFCFDKSTYLDVGSLSANMYACRNGSWGLIGGGSGSGISALSQDVVASGSGSVAATVKGINGVPLCTGFTPTNGQALQYTTALSPNPCFTAAGASSVSIQHQGSTTGINQAVLNFLNSPSAGLDPNFQPITPKPDGSGGWGSEVPMFLASGASDSESSLGLGGLVGAFTDGSGHVVQVIAIGNLATVFPVPIGATQLQLGIDDNIFADNTGSFTVAVSVNGGSSSNVTVLGTSMPWDTTINAGYPFGENDGTSPVVALSSLSEGSSVRIAYSSGNVSAGPGGSHPSDANGYLTNPLAQAGAGGPTGSNSAPVNGDYWPTRYASVYGQVMNKFAMVYPAAGLAKSNGSAWIPFSPSQCGAGQAPTGIDSNGNATGCQSIGGGSSSSRLPNWQTAFLKVRNGTGNAIILAEGDSTTKGYGAGPSGSMYDYAYPVQLAQFLTSSYGVKASWDNWFGGGNASTDSVLNQDNRITTTGGTWSQDTSFYSLGGDTITTSTASAKLTFAPVGAIDHCTIYYVTGPSQGTLNLFLDSNSPTSINTNAGSVGFSSTTLAAGSAGTHTVNHVLASGSKVDIIGDYCYNSTVSQVYVINAGSSAAQSAQFALTTNTFSPGNPGIYNAIAPDIVIFGSMINDWNASVSIPTFTSNMQTHVSNLLGLTKAADVVLWAEVPSSPGVAYTTQSTYVEALRGIAAANAIPGASTSTLPLIDNWTLFVGPNSSSGASYGWTYANNNGWMFDNLHPNLTGYGLQSNETASFLVNAFAAGHALSAPAPPVLGTYPTPVTVNQTSAANVINITGCITPTYEDYAIRISHLKLASGSGVSMYLQFSPDNGATWDQVAANYHFSQAFEQVNTGSSQGFHTSQSATGFVPSGFATDTFSSGMVIDEEIDLHDPASTDGVITAYYRDSSYYSSTSVYSVRGSILYSNPLGATAFRIIIPSGGTFTAKVTCQPLPQ